MSGELLSDLTAVPDTGRLSSHGRYEVHVDVDRVDEARMLASLKREMPGLSALVTYTGAGMVPGVEPLTIANLTVPSALDASRLRLAVRAGLSDQGLRARHYALYQVGEFTGAAADAVKGVGEGLRSIGVGLGLGLVLLVVAVVVVGRVLR